MIRFVFLIWTIFGQVCSQLRLCEADGSCRQCADNRYSYYRCRMQDDCFIGEVCDNGFCCPNAPPTFSLQRELTPSMSLVCGSNEQYSACYSACQPSCQNPSTPSCPPPNCQPGCVCMPGFIRRDGSPRSACVPRALCQAFDLTIRCADDRRQYQTCGSACPISCSTRNAARCESARCVSGCFCRIPYILADAADPLHSRCILPADCPPDDTMMGASAPMINEFIARNPQLAGRFSNYPTSPLPTPTPPTPPTLIPTSPASHCADPLKNFLNCGSACPASCDRPLSQAASLECALSCVVGCFCRLPYVLVDSKDPNSSCILPQLCPRKSIPPSSATIIPSASTSTPSPSSTTSSTPSSLDTCSDPRKQSSNCTSAQCAPSCTNPLGRCSSSAAAACTPGCICRPPYVLLHPRDPNSRCVLPSECERGCEDDNKEFLACGSSCPMGCDNRRPKSCAPCQTGCFCRNGLVFEKSATWHTSKCIKLEECPPEEKEEEETTTTTTTTTLPFLELPVASSSSEAKIIENNSSNPPTPPMLLSSDTCPPTTFDVGGRGCSSDMDCPVEQRCCRPLIASLGVSPQRCVCPDKNAVWSACGTICPEYCGQPAVPRCSNTCQAGCHCAPGFVRARNDVGAPCVPRESCEPARTRIAASNDDVWYATIREIPSVEHQLDQRFDTIAIAILTGQNGETVGRFTFSQISSTTIKIHGEVFGLPVGKHAVVVHQFGDPSEGCSRVGGPFSRSSAHSPSVGDISEGGKFDRIVDWPVYDIVGRALVIYRFSTNEWMQRTHNGEQPLACGTIGIAKT